MSHTHIPEPLNFGANFFKTQGNCRRGEGTRWSEEVGGFLTALPAEISGVRHLPGAQSG